MNHTVTSNGDYELCFNNRYSAFTSKKVMWELDVVGDEEKLSTNEEIVLAVNQTLEAYKEEAMAVGIETTVWTLTDTLAS